MCTFLYSILQFFLKRTYLFIFRGEGREKERERNMDLWPLVRALTRDPTATFTSWDNTQLTEQHQSGLQYFFIVATITDGSHPPSPICPLPTSSPPPAFTALLSVPGYIPIIFQPKTLPSKFYSLKDRTYRKN